MKLRVWSMISLVVLVATIATACAADDAAPATDATSATESAGGEGQAPEGQSLNILVESGGRQLQQPIADRFQEETGVEVNFVEVPYQQVFDRLSAELAAGGAGYDVATVDVIWLPRFAAFAEPLDELFTEAVRNDLFPALVEDAQIDGTYVGMPQWANAEILFYRTDLFEDPDNQAAFEEAYGYELQPPTDWEQYRDIAQFFSETTELYGTDAKGAVETEWLATVLQAGAPSVVLDDNGEVIIDNEAHVNALEFYSGLHCEAGVTPSNVTEIDWNLAQNLFYQGQTAMMPFWAHAYRMTPEDSQIAGNVGVAPMLAGPGGVGAIPGPWYNIVPRTGQNKDLAMEYVRFAYEHNALQIETPLGLAARISAYEQYADESGFEHFNPLIETLNAPSTSGRPLVQNWQEITDQVLIPLVQEAFQCERSPQEILGDAAEEIRGMQQ